MAKETKKKAVKIKEAKPLVRSYPEHRYNLPLGFAVAFIVNFTFYLAGLAPTVTFEDSGELIAAAYTVGVPHEPGYPLFTMLGKLFTLLPFGDIAYRVNLMSAVFSALGAAFVYLIAVYLMDALTAADQKTFSFRRRLFPSYMAAGIASVAVGLSPSYFSQSVITEVYALNNFFTGALLFILMKWYRLNCQAAQSPENYSEPRKKWFYIYSLFCGLTLTNHHTALIFVPLGLIFILIVNRRFLFDAPLLLKAFAAFFIGLLPYLYLPLASSANPAMDWGDPESWTNFWRVVTRHQYGLDIDKPRSAQVLLSQIALHYQLLAEQYRWVWITAGMGGLIWIWKKNRALFYLTLLFAFFTGPLVAYVTNVDITIKDPFAIAEQKALVSVMYLPFYMYWGVLAAVTIFYMYDFLRVKFRFILAAAWLLGLTAYAFYYGYTGFRSETMGAYHYVSGYKDNLFKITEPNAFVLVNWDPFAFTMMYYQMVEKQRPDMIFIDVELLRRTWYIKMLRHQYPDFMEKCKAETDAFLSAVKPFEDKEKFDPNFIQSKYIGMINTMIDRAYVERPVYFTIYYPIRPLEKGIAPGYKKESVLVAQRLIKENDLIPDVDISSLNFEDLLNPLKPKDRMANMLKNYYAILFAERAIGLEFSRPTEAINLYVKAVELAESPVILNNIQKRYQFYRNAVKF